MEGGDPFAARGWAVTHAGYPAKGAPGVRRSRGLASDHGSTLDFTKPVNPLTRPDEPPQKDSARRLSMRGNKRTV